MRDRTGVRWLALAALLAVVATACGGTEESGSAPPQTPPDVGFPPWATAPVVRATRPAVDKIAFESSRGDIWVVNPDGTGRKRLTEGKSSTGWAGLSWSPEGTRIAFVGRGGGGIHTMNADGTDVVQLTDPVAADGDALRSPGGARVLLDRSPSWSPDGARIAFVREIFASARDFREVPHVVNVDGSGLRALSMEDGFAMHGDLSWAPDGTEVVFFAYTETTADPLPPQFVYEEGWYAVDVQTEEFRAMEAPLGGQSGRALPRGWWILVGVPPVFSPDGERITFLAQRDRQRRLFVMNADGSGLKRLTLDLGFAWGPTWSPDGTRIALNSVRHRGSDPQVFVMNADGSAVTQITFSLPEVPYGSSPAGSPAWSPVSATSSDHKGNGDGS